MGGTQSHKRKEEDEYEEEELVENEYHVEIGDQNAVKNLLDDTINEFFQEHKDYTVQYGWDNVKLLLLVLAAGIAATAQFYRSPMITERVLIYSCVIGFFAIHALLLAYTVFVERDIAVRMTGKSSSSLLVKTSFPHTAENYTVVIEDAANPGHKAKAELYIGKYFDAEGYFDRDTFLKHIDALRMQFEKQKAQ
ncbi:hypothetical protein Poli38472_003351 [Pythium oligandrum]|uniref:Signal peptidase complex subunit 2 n=1 Tax=Pythium oligandrum TaxID=41045 RepID=A0A8K1C6D2_PYTOL|nr:hypothetical protein Poli38472_003351 [Pythium oligandrum]|eukprot:TMW57426.1 hypothetical protein Poli38472_003351 [Pythium oligandrum]